MKTTINRFMCKINKIINGCVNTNQVSVTNISSISDDFIETYLFAYKCSRMI